MTEKFWFLDYDFDRGSRVAEFRYRGADGTEFAEKVQFAEPLAKVRSGETAEAEFARAWSEEALDRALFLCFVLIGTSYYKAHPTAEVELDFDLDSWQAEFFSRVYQEGLSQYAYENGLKREDLAHFRANIERDIEVENSVQARPITVVSEGTPRVLSLQSGGKDSLLTATLLAKNQIPYTAWYLTSGDAYPNVLDRLPSSGAKVEKQIARRTLDLAGLKATGGLNGHVPITYIVQSLALVQAILNGQSYVLTSIGQEGNEPHAYIGDLAVNHQWSKTWSAEQAFAEYIRRYIVPAGKEDIRLGSPLRCYSELAIAEKFAELCWQEYGHDFSSCNEANYRQRANNQRLEWCGDCAKCANSYLLFAPFLPPEELQSLFHHEDLFTKPSLFQFFKGLLGVDGVMKPFECVGEVAELRRAYHLRRAGYGELPFEVPESDFDFHKLGEMQEGLRLE